MAQDQAETREDVEAVAALSAVAALYARGEWEPEVKPTGRESRETKARRAAVKRVERRLKDRAR